MKRGLLAFLALLLCPVIAGAYTETFYVCEGGDGSLPETATCATAYDGADFNTAGNWDTDDQDDGKIGPNDLVIILNDGGVLRAQFTIQQSGLSGKPITIQGESGTDPIISGADVFQTWIAYEDTTNLQGHWKLEEAGGAARLDETANSNDLTDNNTVGQDGTNYREGSYSADFNGTNMYLSLADGDQTGIDIAGSITLAAWVRPEASGERIVIGKGQGGGNERSYYLRKTAGEVMECMLSNDGAAQVKAYGDDTLSLNTWYHVACVYDGTDIRVYLDGVLDSNGANNPKAHTTGIDVNNQDFAIGRPGADGYSYWSGQIDDARVYNTDLSAAEILNLKNSNNRTPTTWQKTGVTTEPKIAFIDDGIIDLGTDQNSLSDHEWYWTGNVMYLRDDTGDPDGSGIEVEASQRYSGMQSNGKSYLAISDLTLEMAEQHGLVLFGDAADATVDSCLSRKNGDFGFLIGDEFATGYSDVTISDCETTLNGQGGFKVNGATGRTVDNVTISDSTSHEDGWDERVGYRAGIKVYGSDVTNVTIENNTVYHACRNAANGNECSDSTGNGFWVDTGGAGIVFRYNKSYDNKLEGLFIEITDDAEMYYNIAYGNGGAGVKIGQQGAVYTADGNKLYNNVSYNNDIGIQLEGADATGKTISDNLVKNNIAFGNTTHELSAVFGGENPGANGSGNVYLNNCLGVEAAAFVEWGWGVDKATYDAWETAYGSTTNSVEADPTFTDAASDDFTLQPGSPAINLGTDVSLVRDYVGTIVPQGSAQDIGAYEWLESGRLIFDSTGRGIGVCAGANDIVVCP